MMRDHIDQNLRCGADRLPLLLSFIDQRLSFSVQTLRLSDNRLRPIEKINQRLGRWQRFLNLPELCITETGNVTNEVNEPVVQHSSTLLVATNSRRATRPGEGSWWLSLCRPQERRADYPIFRRTKPSRRLPMGASLICCLQRSRLHRSGSAVASPRSGLRGPRLLADGTRAPDLAQRPVEPAFCLSSNEL